MSGGMGKIVYYKNASGSIRPLWTKFRKHYCQKCGSKLIISKLTHYGIESGSIEAKNKNLSLPFDVSNHPLDYTFTIFECSKCCNKVSIDDQYHIENPTKKKRFKYDDYHEYLKSYEKKWNKPIF